MSEIEKPLCARSLGMVFVLQCGKRRRICTYFFSVKEIERLGM
jgi:hypothetical protein